jgi:hypothetical protein
LSAGGQQKGCPQPSNWRKRRAIMQRIFWFFAAGDRRLGKEVDARLRVFLRINLLCAPT